MNNALFMLLNMFMIALESIMTILLTNSLFKRRYSKKIHALLATALVVTHNLLLFFISTFSLPKLGLLLILMVLWIKITYRTELGKCVFEAFLLLSYWTIVDNSFIIGSTVLGHGDVQLLSENPYAYYTICYCAKIIEFLGLRILCFWIKNRLSAQEASWTDWLRTLFFPVATLLISLFLAQILYLIPEQAFNLLVCTLILLLADIVSIFLLEHMEKQQAALRDNVILRQNLRQERDGIAAWMDAYKEQRRQSHDFQNQLAVLYGMLESNASREDFSQYLENLLNVELPITLYINTHRSVADVLLSQKSAIAKSKDIKFSTELDDLSVFTLPDDALVIVLSNLLDNAIEACEKISNADRRYILLKMRCEKDASYLYIENSTAEFVKIQDNRVVIPKGHPIERGYGLQNIATMLDRYNAMYAIEYRDADSVFCFSAQFFSND